MMLLPSTTGAAIVWFPPLLLMVAEPLVFDNVKLFTSEALNHVAGPPLVLNPRLAKLGLISSTTVPVPLVRAVPKTATS